MIKNGNFFPEMGLKKMNVPFFLKNILLFLLLPLLSCSQSKIPMADIEPVLPVNQMNLSYLALGDSYTIGEGVAENERWPVQLRDQLNREGFQIINPKIIARTGWTTDELENAIEAEVLTDTFDLVSLLIGVNNQYRGRTPEQFRPELVRLIDKALSFAAYDTSRVFMVSIPDWGVTPFANGRDRQKIASEIDAFNAVIQEEALARNILFVDITPISREAASDLSLLAPDNLHPSASMYRRWVDEILPLLLNQIQLIDE